MNYRSIDDNAEADNTLDEFRVEDVMIYVKGPVGDRANFFSEFMVNPNSADDEIGSAHDQSVRVERMYLSTDQLIPDHSLKAGLYQNFDGIVKDYHVATGNPLPGDVIFFKNPWVGHHGNGTLHDVFTDVGLSLSGRRGGLGYKLNVFNGMGERTPERSAFEDAEPEGLFGKLQYTFRNQSLRGLQVGLSYYRAKGTEQVEKFTETELVADTQTGEVTEVTDVHGSSQFEPKDEYWIGELIYRRPRWTASFLYLNGEQTRAVSHEEHELYGIPFGERDHEGDGYLAELQYNTTDKLTLVGRYQTVSADDESMNFLGAGSKVGHHGPEHRGDLEQTELGLNYSWSPRITFKTSWQGNEEDGVYAAGDRIFGQLAASF